MVILKYLKSDGFVFPGMFIFSFRFVVTVLVLSVILQSVYTSSHFHPENVNMAERRGFLRQLGEVLKSEKKQEQKREHTQGSLQPSLYF